MVLIFRRRRVMAYCLARVRSIIFTLCEKPSEKKKDARSIIGAVCGKKEERIPSFIHHLFAKRVALQDEDIFRPPPPFSP